MAATPERAPTGLAEAATVVADPRAATARAPRVASAPSAAPVVEATERTEHRETLLRTRSMLRLVIAAMPVVFALDLAIVLFVEPASVLAVLLARTAALVGLLGSYLWLRRDPGPDGRALLRIERVTTTFTAMTVGASALVAGGVSSVYLIGGGIVLVGRSAMRSDRWRDAMPSVLAVVVVPPLMVVAAAPWSPRIAAQLGTGRDVALMALYVFATFLTALIVLASGDAIWKLRREVYEARQIGRYQLKHRIGSGGMGEVWAAYFPALRRDVAIKLLRRNQADAIGAARFEREARATADLRHPNTVRVFDFGQTDDGLCYYAMELLEGETLAALVEREGPLAPARAVHLVAQAAGALAEAHGRGIVHRDVKPENLFVTAVGAERDFVKLLDFGIAQVAADTDANLTSTGALIGSPRYLSPEVVGGHGADARSDVYGLGATLYFALTGRPPYDAPDLAALLPCILAGGAAPPSQARGAPLPATLDALVLRCLALEAAARYASAVELVAALAALDAELATGSRPR